MFMLPRKKSGGINIIISVYINSQTVKKLRIEIKKKCGNSRIAVSSVCKYTRLH